MAASVDCTVKVELIGLGKSQTFNELATDGTTPTEASYLYKVLGTADTEEALDLGGITTVSMLAIRAIDYDLFVDLDWVTALDADFTVKAGEPAALIPNPAGSIYVKNAVAGEQPKFEFLVIGT